MLALATALLSAAALVSLGGAGVPAPAPGPAAPVVPASQAASAPASLAPPAALPASAIAIPAPTSPGAVSLSAELGRPAVLTGSQEPAYLRLQVAAAGGDAGERSPVSMAVALDRSGSMSGDKLDQAKAAVDHLIDLLGPADRLALVIYDDAAQLLYPSSPLTPEHRAAMHRAVAGVETAGSTNLSDGLELAARQARQAAASTGAVSRVLLVSDGLANRGLTDPAVLAALARRFRQQSLTISTIGVGVDFDHRLMSDLAESGAGGYHYLRDAGQLAQVFAEELRRAAAAVARGVSLVIKPADGVRVAEVYGFTHYADAAGVVSVQLPDLHAGASWQLICRLAMPAAQGSSQPVAEARLVYTDLQHGSSPRVAAAGPLAAEVTPQAERVRDAENQSVMVEVVRMEGALAAQRASLELEQGRNQEAARILAQAQQATDRANQRYQSPKLFSFSGNLRALFASSANALGGEERNDLAKRQHKMLRDFSENSSR
jgi:Ca-activated chloride channel family protein